MGRQAQAAGEDWDLADEFELDDDIDTDDTDGDAGEAEDTAPRPTRRPAGGRRLARRLIEQARENLELSRRLADFEDYVL